MNVAPNYIAAGLIFRGFEKGGNIGCQVITYLDLKREICFWEIFTNLFTLLFWKSNA
jgi:hypothetical protein